MDKDTVVRSLTDVGDAAAIALVLLLVSAAVVIAAIVGVRRRRKRLKAKAAKVWRDGRRAHARAEVDSNGPLVR